MGQKGLLLIVYFTLVDGMAASGRRGAALDIRLLDACGDVAVRCSPEAQDTAYFARPPKPLSRPPAAGYTLPCGLNARVAGAQTSAFCPRIVRRMKPALTTALLPWPLQGDVVDNRATLSLEQVAQLSGVGTVDLRGLVDRDVLTPVTSVTPVTPVSDSWTFRWDCVITLQRVANLRQDLVLDDHGFALSMMLLRQLTEHEGELAPHDPICTISLGMVTLTIVRIDVTARLTRAVPNRGLSDCTGTNIWCPMLRKLGAR